MLSRDRRGDPGGRRHHSRRGVVRRQLPRRGRGVAAGARGSPERILPPAPQARGGAASGISPRARGGLGVRRTHRQPLRAGDASALRPPLPAGPAPDDRRALGHPDRPAARARREPAAPGRANREEPRGAARGRRAGRRAARARRTDPPPARLPAVRSRRAVPRLHGEPRAAPARAGPRVHPRTAMARREDERARHVARRARAARPPQPGRDERDRAQRDHEHADDVDAGLGRLLRERQPRRRSTPRRPPLPRDGLCHPRSVPARDRGSRPGRRALRARHHPAGDGPRHARRRGLVAWRRRSR